MTDNIVVLPNELPNPLTPMAFFSPDVAYERTITVYVEVGMLAVLAWDILSHFSCDFKLLFKYKITLASAIYTLARWSTLLYVLSAVIVETAPLGNCTFLARLSCSVYHISVSSTELLFFLRVRAVYNKNKYITMGFFSMWLAVVGGTLTVIPGINGSTIGPTKYCLFGKVAPYTSVAYVAVLVFDTAVFVAISWRFLSVPHSESGLERHGGRFSFSFPSRRLSAFSRAFIEESQKYYLIALIANLLAVIFIYAPEVPPGYKELFRNPSVVMTNIMGCYVYRHTRFGSYQQVMIGAIPQQILIEDQIKFASRDRQEVEVLVSKDTISESSEVIRGEKKWPAGMTESAV